jgi:predicted Zn-dependent protease
VLIFGKWQAGPKVTNDPIAKLAQLDAMPNTTAPIIAKYRLSTLRGARDPKHYQNAADDFLAKFPTDPAAPWIRHRRLYGGTDVPALVGGLRELAKVYGEDPFLDAVAASVLANNRQFAEAVPLAKKAMAAVPNHQLPSYILAGSALETGDYEAAAEGMLAQSEKFGVLITSGNLKEKHPKFCESEPGRGLLEKLPEHPPAPASK